MTISESIEYQVQISALSGHVIKVKQRIPTSSVNLCTLFMPAWIPGSYMVRDFARNVVSLVARDDENQPLPVHKLDKQTWSVACKQTQSVCVEYEIYAYDLSVRSAYINDQYAFFNGTSVFLQVQQLPHLPCSLALTLDSAIAPNWQVATSLPQGNKEHHFHADNYLSLIDHPVIAGELDRHVFEVNGVSFELILAGGHQADTQRICEDLSAICSHHLALFDKPYPTQRYLFITLLCDNGFGGLEHTSSTVLQYARNQLPGVNAPAEKSDGYKTFLSLCSHELFHTWHVKATKPTNMLHPDLSQEVYTEQLWIYEGFTSYFDDLSLLRCGLISVDEYLEIVGANLTRLSRNPGNQLQTVTESSFDAWTRFYKQDANAANSIVSYYTKGGIIALCLDLKMRLETNNQHTLFDLVTIMWRKYGLTAKGTDDKVVHDLLKSEFNLQLDDFLDAMLYTTQPTPEVELLAQFGVQVQKRPRVDHKDKGGKAAEKVATVDFGAIYTSAPLGVKITQVLAQRAAYTAGLHVGDTVIAIDNWQVQESSFQAQLDNTAKNQQCCELAVLRDGRLLPLSMPLTAAIADTVVLCSTDISQRDKWLKGP